jgi:hypothetical protein
MAMDTLLYLLGPLGCAAMMGAMLWMMRGQHAGQGQAAQPDPATREEIAALRAEVAALRAEQAQRAESPQPTTQR